MADGMQGEALRGFIAKLLARDVLYAKHASYISRGKNESCVLALARHRVVLYSNRSKKVEMNCHLLEVKSLTSVSSSTVTIGTDKVTLQIEATEVDSFLVQFFLLLSQSFPACNLKTMLTIKISPTSRADRVWERVEWDAEASIAKTFRPTYEALCDQQDLSPQHDLIWIMERVYIREGRRTLCLQDFDHLPTAQILTLLSTLRYTSWFKGLESSERKLSSDVAHRMLNVVHGSITSLTLSGVGQLGDSLGLLASVDLKLLHLDLSENGLDDKEMLVLGNVLHRTEQLQRLDLSGSSFTGKGLRYMCDALKHSCSMSLLSLSLARCVKVQNDAWAPFLELICHLVSLQRLSLADTSLSIDTLWTPLLHGCSGQLRSLNLARAKFAALKSGGSNPSYSKAYRWLITCQEVRELDLSGCKIPPPFLKVLLAGISENILLTNMHLILTGCEIGQAGWKQMEPTLGPMSNLASLDLQNNELNGELLELLTVLEGHKGLRHLNISDNGAKLREKKVLVSKLIALVESYSSTLISLDISNLKLKMDLYPFLGVLARNTKLQELNVSGNLIGNAGIRILAHSLSVNNAIRKLTFDNNQTGVQGFKDLAAGLAFNKSVRQLPLPFQDIASLKANEVAPFLHKMSAVVEANNAPTTEGDDILLHQQHFLNSSENVVRLEKAAQELVDVLLTSKRRGDDMAGLKKDGLKLLTEAEHCYKIMKELHDKADSHRKEIYACVTDSGLYRTMSDEITTVVNKELGRLGEQYYGVLGGTMPTLLSDEKNSSKLKGECSRSCSVTVDSIYSTLSKELQHEIAMSIGKCMLTAETKISAAVVDAMVEKLTTHARQVEEASSAAKNKEREEREERRLSKDSEHEELDESLQQRRHTFTTRSSSTDQAGVPASRCSSTSSPSKPPKPTIAAKPKGRLIKSASERSSSESLSNASGTSLIKKSPDVEKKPSSPVKSPKKSPKLEKLPEPEPKKLSPEPELKVVSPQLPKKEPSPEPEKQSSPEPEEFSSESKEKSPEPDEVSPEPEPVPTASPSEIIAEEKETKEDGVRIELSPEKEERKSSVSKTRSIEEETRKSSVSKAKSMDADTRKSSVSKTKSVDESTRKPSVGAKPFIAKKPSIGQKPVVLEKPKEEKEDAKEDVKEEKEEKDEAEEGKEDVKDDDKDTTVGEDTEEKTDSVSEDKSENKENEEEEKKDEDDETALDGLVPSKEEDKLADDLAYLGGEHTSQLNSITKGRVRAKKKKRPMKAVNTDIETVDPFKAAGGHANGEVAPAARPARPPGPRFGGAPMMPMGAGFLGELGSRIGGSRGNTNSNAAETPPAATEESAPTETAPSPRRFQPPRGPGGPMMGMPAVNMSELQSRLNSRRKD